MKPLGSAAQTVTHMGETRRLQVMEEKLLFKGCSEENECADVAEKRGEDVDEEAFNS